MIAVIFGTVGIRHGVHQLGAVLGDPARARTARPTMKPVMFCRKTSGMPRSVHSSMKCVALSADSENRTPLLATMPTSRPWMRAKPVTIVVRVARLELVEPRAVDEPRDHLADVVLPPQIRRHDAVQLLRIVAGIFRGRDVDGRRLRRVQRRDDGPGQLQRVRVVLGEVVGDAGQARVNVGAAELLGRDVLAGGRLHERRPAEEDRARALDDDRLVRHRGHVRAAGRARSHDDGHLRNPLGRHARLVEEDPAEVIAVGKDLGLQRQERATRVHEIDTRQAIGERDFLRAQVLAHGDGVVGAALHRRVVGDDEHFASRDAADARDQAGARRVVLVHVPRRQRRELEKRRAGIEEAVDAFADRELALGAMPFERLGSAAQAGAVAGRLQRVDGALHGGARLRGTRRCRAERPSREPPCAEVTSRSSRF